MRPAECNVLRDWASSYGAAVRQQEIAKRPPWPHMAQSEFMYRRQRELLETNGCIAFDGHVNTTERVAETELEEDEADLFNESSD